PPFDQGGQCAGEAEVAVTEQTLKRPIRVVLRTTPLQRSRFRGRLLSPEKLPIVGAHVVAERVEPAGQSECTSDGGVDVSGTSGPDGAFELPPLPHGKVKLKVEHRWYPARQVEVAVPSREREIVLDRGLAWSGRVLDPDGKMIDHCELFLKLS